MLKRISLIAAILTIFLLSACSASQPDEGALNAQPTAQLAETEAQENAGEPTETDSQMESSPAEATNASADSDEPTPTSTPTAMPTQNSNSQVSPLSESCYNAWFPVFADTTWRYIIEDSSGSTDYTISYTDISENEFIALNQFDDISVDTRWICEGGELFASEYTQFNISGLEGDIDFVTIDYEGKALPAKSEWEVGVTWTTHYTVKATINVEDSTLESEWDLTLNNEITDISPVSVPAGDYKEAASVATEGKVDIKTGLMQPFDISYTTWYAKDVGMVKQISNTQAGKSTTLLVAFE